MSNIYPFSVFYFTKSVYDGVGKNDDDASKLILSSVLINTRFKEKIGAYITFTTKDIIDLVRKEEYIDKFIGLMQLGRNMAYPEDSEDIRGDINFKLIQFAVNKDGEIYGIVKIVVEDYETRQALQKIIDEDRYPFKLVTIKEALLELKFIEKSLYGLFN